MQAQPPFGQPHILQNSVVVFSKNYLPLARINIKRAIVLLVTGQAESLNFGTTKQWEVRSPSVVLQVSEHIRLTVGLTFPHPVKSQISIAISSSLNTGGGNDTIIGNGTGGIGGFGGNIGGNGGTGTGINNSGSLNAGNGNDTITGNGTGGIGGNGIAGGLGGRGTGINNSGNLNAGNGNNTIIGKGTSGNRGNGIQINTIAGEGIGIRNTKDGIVTAGSGNDTIKGYGNSSQLNAIVYGIFNDGDIQTGNGGDILIGHATGTDTNATAYGIYGQGSINTGNGNDKIIATSTINEVQQKVTIGGGISIDLGRGNDYFKGFGAATVDGGKGFDTLDLSAFNRSELTISGVSSVNTLNPAIIAFNNDGNLITMSTTGFENFIFADSSLSYSSLV